MSSVKSNLYSSTIKSVSDIVEGGINYKPNHVPWNVSSDPIGEQYCLSCLQNFATLPVNRIDFVQVSCRV